MPSDKPRDIAKRFWTGSCRFLASLSFVGIVFAGLYFAVSLTPSLLPRIYLVQGLLSGIAMATGYGIGVLLQWLWNYLEIPIPRGTVERALRWLSFGGMLILAIVFLWRASTWQNSIRQLMTMEPVETAYPIRVTLIAIVIGGLLLAMARAIIWCSRQVNRRVSQGDRAVELIGHILRRNIVQRNGVRVVEHDAW